MAIIEKSSIFGKIAEENYKNYLKLICEKNVTIGLWNSDGENILENKIKEAEKAIRAMKLLIENYKGLPVEQDGCYAKWFTVLAVAAYVRFIYFNKKQPFVSLMYAREFTASLAKEAKVPDNEFEFVMQAVESSLGVSGPQKLKAPADTPGEMLVLAVMLVENFASFMNAIDSND